MNNYPTLTLKTEMLSYRVYFDGQFYLIPAFLFQNIFLPKSVLVHNVLFCLIEPIKLSDAVPHYGNTLEYTTTLISLYEFSPFHNLALNATYNRG